MKKAVFLAVGVLVMVAAGTSSLYAADAMEKKVMSREDAVKLALSAAPASIAAGAAVMVPGEDGTMVEAKAGTNGFTCIPDVPGGVAPDPMCMDPAAMEWANSLLSGAPKPTNTVPGISYMAKGGQHYEKDGMIPMQESPGAKLVDEPAHWMLMWPVSAQASGLPTMPNPGGVYVMWDGTPYAHLMIYQNPNKLK
ncbi:MAG: hypothetical protein OEW11_07455 [Nitrospirota bacterium]|nr:hypothetical protein [Nitrospirota bacterium]